MTRYSVQEICKKMDIYLLLETQVVNIVRNFLIVLNNLQQMHLFKTTSKRVIKKTAKATGDLIGNKIANRITKVSQN